MKDEEWVEEIGGIKEFESYIEERKEAVFAIDIFSKLMVGCRVPILHKTNVEQKISDFRICTNLQKLFNNFVME